MSGDFGIYRCDISLIRLLRNINGQLVRGLLCSSTLSNYFGFIIEGAIIVK